MGYKFPIVAVQKKNYQSITVRHFVKSLPNFTSLPSLLSKQLSLLSIFLQNNRKFVVVSNKTTVQPRSKFLCNTFNERIFRFSNCVKHLRNSSHFTSSKVFPLLCVKREFSWLVECRATSAVGLLKAENTKSSNKKSSRLSFSPRFVHSNQGMMVWVSDYDKPDTSVNISFFL